jgi:2-polyprenyl-3-methyl-5-hydroxy-6-metoxy-1,4-benzoquinol methylase
MTDLALIEASWDQAARDDAMFNIITDPDCRDGGWNPVEFFAHGRDEVYGAMTHLADDLRIPRVLHRALDFGCGIGRLSRTLAMHYLHVDGVDISGEMIRQARDLNHNHRIRYHHNPTGDLGLFKARTFDLVYSMIVLQHMPQDMQHGYVREFFRVLKPGGVAMFHTPEGPDSGHPGWHLSMFGVTRETVGEWIAESGGTLVDVEDLGVDSGWRNLRYAATA